MFTVAGTKTLLFASGGLLIGARWIELPESGARAIMVGLVVTVGLQVGIYLARIVRFAVEHESQRRVEGEADTGAATSLGIVRLLGQTVVWSIVLLIVLSNIGVDITALVASIGVGGIAIALAAQNVLGDLFSSLAIILDKPFEVGHFIIVGEFSGTVEKVGLKTTRVRSLGGEQLIFGNSDLLSTRVRNYKRMEVRRIVFGFGLLYGSPADKLEKVPGIAEEIIESTPNTRFDRAHFKAFGASSLDFEVVYYVLAPDYTAYMDAQQSINLALFRRIQEEGLGFAFPTRSLHVESMPETLAKLASVSKPDDGQRFVETRVIARKPTS